MAITNIIVTVTAFIVTSGIAFCVVDIIKDFINKKKVSNKLGYIK